MSRRLARSVLALLLSLASVTAFAGPAYRLVSYNSWYSGTYTMRVYESGKIALLIPDNWFSDFQPEPNTVVAMGAWPGIKPANLTFMLGWLNRGYDFYADFTGRIPAPSAITPGKIPIAFVNELPGAAAMGLVGSAGIEVGREFLAYSMYAAEKRQMINTVFWHELGRNFYFAGNPVSFDVGVKYVMTDFLKIPTHMAGQYGVTYEQFLLDQAYLLPRYYLADTNATSAMLDGVDSNGMPTPTPAVPSQIASYSVTHFYNGGEIRAGLAFQFFLENGLTPWKKLAAHIRTTDMGKTYDDVLKNTLAVMKKLSGKDYSFALKDGRWEIRSWIDSGDARSLTLQRPAGIGTYVLGGYGNDTITLADYGQYRIDGGDGQNTVVIAAPLSANAKVLQNGWNVTVSDSSLGMNVSLNFVSTVVIGNKTLKFNMPYSNTLPPFAREIRNNRGTTTLKNGDSVILRFSETIFPSSSDNTVMLLRDIDADYNVGGFSLSDGTLAFSGNDLILKNVQGVIAGHRYQVIAAKGNVKDRYDNLAPGANDDGALQFPMTITGNGVTTPAPVAGKSVSIISILTQRNTTDILSGDSLIVRFSAPIIAKPSGGELMYMLRDLASGHNVQFFTLSNGGIEVAGSTLVLKNVVSTTRGGRYQIIPAIGTLTDTAGILVEGAMGRGEDMFKTVITGG